MSRGTGRSALAVRAGGAAMAAALLLTGCAGDVDGELRRAVADVTDDANAGDYEAVQDSANALIERAQDAVRSNDVSPEEGARIIELATLLRDRAAALEPAEPSPTPEPTEQTETETVTEQETETEEVETEVETEPSPTRPPSPRPTQPPPSPPTQPSPPAPEETLLPEVPEG